MWSASRAPIPPLALAAKRKMRVVPVLVGDEAATMDLTRMLFDRGVFVCPIVHPAVPRDTNRLRTTIMATHTEEDIAQALDAFAHAGQALGLI